MSDNLLSFENPVFSHFAFYAGVCLCKTMLMSVLTARHRIKNKTFANPEDFMGSKRPLEERKAPPNQDVERVRRCHLNDIENVIPFVLIGLLYVCTKPDPSTALMHFRAFTGFRIFHSIAYLLPLPQPSRVLGFLLGVVVTGSMAFTVLRTGAY